MLNRRELIRVSLVSAGAAAAVPTVSIAAEASAAPNSPLLRPKLASNCTKAELAERARALAQARQTYVWSTTVPNVEGIPMSRDIPVGENPSLDWFIELAQGILNLLENIVDSALVAIVPQMRGAIIGFSLQLRALKDRLFDVIKQANVLIKKYAGATLHTVVEAIDKTAFSVIVESLLAIVRALQEIRKNLLLAVQNSLESQKIWIGDVGDPNNLTKYNALWGSMPIPEPSKHLHDDAFFARTRVAGANPMIIRRVDGALPTNLRLDADKAAEVMGESLTAAIAAGRLYMTDYRDLGTAGKEDATFKVLTGEMYNTAPIAIFVRPASSRDLKPVAIQVGQRAGKSPVFYPPLGTGSERHKSARYWGWEMAKTVVQTADFNHHELFSHLSWTHLVSEAFCMATKRTLPQGHPLWTLLDPHFEGDMYINNLAASIIMGPLTIADMVLAPDIHVSQSTAGRARLGWHFEKAIPENDFANRGMDDPELDFPYRDDARTIWSAIEPWVGEYLAIYYPDDAAVRSDPDLQNWLKEAAGPGKVAGIPKVDSVASLRRVLTMVIFTASAQHAALNYPQRDELAYMPFSPGAMKKLPTDPNREYTAKDWFEMMPTFLGSLAQLYFLNVLGSLYYRRLGEYKSNVFPHPDIVVDPPATKALSAFHRRLESAEATITRRNKTRTWHYDYLLPSKIPASTNI